MSFWNWLSAPGYHWAIVAVLILAVGKAVQWAVHGTEGMYEDDE